MTTPIIESQRILLRPLSVEDAETIFRNWTSDEEVAKYMRWDLHETVEEWCYNKLLDTDVSFSIKY